RGCAAHAGTNLMISMVCRRGAAAGAVVILSFECPAPDHRVKGGPLGRRYAMAAPPLTRCPLTGFGAYEQPMRRMSNAGLRVLGRAELARGWCAWGLLARGLTGDGKHGSPDPPLLDLTRNRVCPNSPHPSLSRGAGGAPRLTVGFCPWKTAGSPAPARHQDRIRRRPSPPGHQQVFRHRRRWPHPRARGG